MPRGSEPLIIDPDGPRLVARSDRGALLVDASGHALWVKDPTGEVHALGASQPGVDEVVRLAGEHLGALDDDERARLAEANVAALRRAATERSARLGPVERQIHSIQPTVHLYSAPFLRAEFLRKDARAFHACRVAIALLQRDSPLAASPDAVEDHVEVLTGWRALWRQGGTSKKVVNRLLADVDDALAPDLVWGLRRTRLTQEPASRIHLEVLGALGALSRHADLHAHMALIERSSEAEVKEALDDTASHPFGQTRGLALAHVVAEVISALAVGPKTSLRRIVRTALEEMAHHARDRSETARPPWGLPHIAGVRFLRTAAEITEEGQQMNHCVATRIRRAVEGRSFIFHIDHDGFPATAEVTDLGRILEIRGPFNRWNPAVRWAQAHLAEWLEASNAAAVGRRLAKKATAARPTLAWRGLRSSTPIWLGDRPAPPSATPFRFARDAMDFYERVMAGKEDMFFGRFDWLMNQVERAAYGAAYITAWPGEGATITRVHDRRGKLSDERSWAT